MEAMLSPYKSLDLADYKGFLCGKILADLGADVIKIEPPGGCPSRNIGPFYRNIPHPERSLYWFAYNAGKRGITLDIETAQGEDILKKLAAKADFIIESFSPGYLDSLGLGYEALQQVNPRLIMTSITPFGQSGPYKDYKATDLVGMAMGGLMYLTGDSDRPPVRISFPQAYLHAAADAACGTLLAHYHRELTGQGQHVDVSMQQSVVWTMMNARPFWELTGTSLKRVGPFRAGLSSGSIQRQTWSCRDGAVTFIVMGGAGGAGTNRALVEWMDEEGMADEELRGIDWDAFDMAAASREFHQRIEEKIGRFFAAHTKEELFVEAVKRRIMLYPVSTPADIALSPQLIAREYWVEVEHAELGACISYPGAFLKSSEAPCSLRRRAPLIGEHNQEVYQQELGLSNEQLAALREASVI